MNWVNNLYLPEHFIYGSCCSQLEGSRVGDSFPSDWCHLEVHKFKPITLGAGSPAQQRKACLPKHTHSLIKTAKGEDQGRISFRLKLHANFNVKTESDLNSH